MLKYIEAVLVKLLLYLLKIAISYLSYFALAKYLLIFIMLLLIAGINFSKGELNLKAFAFLIPFIDWLGISSPGSYDINDFIIIFSKISLILGLIGYILELILRKVFNKVLKAGKMFGVIAISAVFFISILSTISPFAKKGAISTLPILLLFWIS